MFDYLRLFFTKWTQWVCGGVEKIGVGFQQWSVTDSKARKEDSFCMVANGRAILCPREPTIQLGCPRIFWWWICRCFAVEESC